MAVKSKGVYLLLMIIRENSRRVVKNGLDFCWPTLVLRFYWLLTSLTIDAYVLVEGVGSPIDGGRLRFCGDRYAI